MPEIVRAVVRDLRVPARGLERVTDDRVAEPIEHLPIACAVLERDERADLLAALVVEEQSEAIVECFMAAIRDGDWRAAEALLTRVFGKPAEKVEVSQPQTLEEVEELSLAQIRELRRLHSVGSESSG